MELQRNLELRVENKLDGNIQPKKKGADKVYVFCPDFDYGLVFSDYTREDEIDRVVDSTRTFDFLTSDEELTFWDEEINGVKNDNLSVDSKVALLVRDVSVPSKEGMIVSARTIIVTRENLEKIIEQVQKQLEERVKGHKRIHLDCKIIDCTRDNYLGENKDLGDTNKKEDYDKYIEEHDYNNLTR